MIEMITENRQWMSLRLMNQSIKKNNKQQIIKEQLFPQIGTTMKDKRDS